MPLVGEETIDINTLEDIVSLIKSNDLVKEVNEEKAVMIGSKKFRFYADISFDIEVINIKLNIFFNFRN